MTYGATHRLAPLAALLLCAACGGDDSTSSASTPTDPESSETAQSETDQSETDQSETDHPETAQPETTQPETTQPPPLTMACEGARGTGAEPPALPPRSQIDVRRILRFGDRTVLDTGAGLLTVDTSTGDVARLAIDELSAVRDVGTWIGRPVVLGSSGGAPALRAERDGAWEAYVVPEGFDQARLVTDGANLVLLQGGHVAISGDGLEWRVIRDAAQLPVAEVLALSRGTLYFGYDRGEFGGGLATVSLMTNPPRVTGGLSQTELPVNGIAAYLGQVWVAQGQAHMGLRMGKLRRFVGAAGTMVSSCDGLNDAERRAMTRQGGCALGCFGVHNWPLEQTSFEGVALDAQHRPVVLSRHQGLVRIDGERPTLLTPSWSYDSYWSGMEIVGDTAVIGTYDAGVVLWDLDGDVVRTVCLPGR